METTPPCPDHPSGFDCTSGAHVRTLQGFLGTDEVAFQVPSPSGGKPRSHTSLSQALDEVILARILQGLHLRTADVQGAGLGQQAAEQAAERLAPAV